MYTYNRKVLKNVAKQDLKPLYWKSVLTYLIATLIGESLIIIMLAMLFQGWWPNDIVVLGVNIATFCMIGVFVYGTCAVFTDIVRTKDFEIKTVFCGFKRFWSTALLYFWQLLFICLWSLLFVIPGIVKLCAYSMAQYIQRDNPDMTVNECLQASIRLTNEHKMDIFILMLSFFGWGLLIGCISGFVGWYNPLASSVISFVGTLLLSPYICMSFARMYDFLILNYNEEQSTYQEKINQPQEESKQDIYDMQYTQEFYEHETETNVEVVDQEGETKPENPFDI